MRLKKLTLTNYRQFLGRNELVLDDLNNFAKNLNLVVGVNGAGKTTLLSALHFVFHGENLDSLDNPNRFCHEEIFYNLQDGQETEVQAEVEFSKDGFDYALQRNLRIRRFGFEEQRLQEDIVLLNLTDGRLITPPTRWINSWFPPNLATFFFFPGENLEDFFEQDNFSKFASDLKSIAGLDQAESILEAGQAVIRKIQRRIASIPGDHEATTLVDAIAALTAQRNLSQTSLEELKSRKTNLESELASLEGFLKSKEQEIGLMAELSEVRLQIKDLELHSLKLESELQNFLILKGWIAFTASSQSRAQEKLKRMQNDGKLSAKYSKSLIGELVNQGFCVCGSDLSEGSIGRIHLEKSLDSLGEISNPQRYLTLASSIDSGLLSLTALSKNWQSMQSELVDLRLKSDQLADRELKLRNQIISESNDDYLESQLGRLQLLKADLEQVNQEIQTKTAMFRELDEKVAQKNSELSAAEASRGQHGVLIRHLQSLDRVLNSISQDSRNSSQNLRKAIEIELGKQIAPVYRNEPVQVSVNPNFELSLTKNGVPISEAKGQVVMRALALVLVLHRIATRNANLFNDEIDSDASQETFPLVIDGGFGVLGEGFIETALDWISQEQSQVVLILLDNVAPKAIHSLGPVGKEVNVLQVQTTGEAKEEAIVIGNAKLELLLAEQSKKRTAIVRYQL